jgi:DUF1680 family protein
MVNGKRFSADVSPSGYVPIRREWRAGDVVEVRMPLTLRTQPLPGAPEYVAFVYGPIVLAGRLGTEGVTPDAQIIVNERTSGNMLNAAIDVPTLDGGPTELVRRARPVRGEPLTFETNGTGRPRDVKLAPFYKLAHERYNLYWKVQST